MSDDLDTRALADLLPRPDDAELGHALLRERAKSLLFGRAPGSRTKIGRFEIERRLGRGGMGEVFLARDEQLRRSVAIKLLHVQLLDADTSVRERSQREAQALARVSHPNVIEVFEVGEHEGRPFVAMEYVEGQTLQAWLDERKPSWREIVQVFVEAGRGLLAAHRVGLIHRDFKPDNVLISGTGDQRRVRVLDFGLARLVAADERLLESLHGSPIVDGDSELTEVGSVLGTPAFMAPEQLRGEVADESSDQFSFCVALYRALWGEAPFGGVGIDQRLACMERTDATPPPKRATARRLWPILRRGLARERGERWPDMGALLDALERSIAARRRWGWVAIAGVAVGLGGGVGLSIMASSDAPGLVAHIAQAVERVRATAACEREASAIDQLWNAETHGRLGEVFTATEHPVAADSWARTRALLDDHAHSWARVWEGACFEAEVEHTRDRESLARIQVCLDERLLSFGARVEALGEIDRFGLSHAVESASELAPPETCLDEHRSRPRLPSSHSPEQARALRARVERVHALRELARFDDAALEAEAVVAEADALGWLPLSAEARHAVGLLSFARGAYAEAEDELERAFELAIASGYDELALRCATKLAWTVGLGSIRYEDGRRWVQLARALLTRLGFENGVHEASVLIISGIIGLDGFRRLEDLERAEQLWTAELGPEHPRVAEVLKYQSRWHADHSHHTQTMALLRRALAIQEHTLGPEHPHLARTLIHLADAQRSLRDFDDAERSLDRALAIQQRAFGPEHPENLETLSARARVLVDRGQLDEALSATMEAARREAELSGADSLSYARNLLYVAQVQTLRGRHDEALALYETMERIYAKQLGSDQAHNPLRLQAQIHVLRGDLDRARDLFERSLELSLRSDDARMTATILADLVQLLPLDDEQLQALRPVLESALAWEYDRLFVPTDCVLRFALARTLEPGSKRALELATIARDELRTDGSDPELLAEIEAWLNEHRPRPSD